MRNTKSFKKANVALDTIIVVIVLFSTVLAFLYISKAFGEINDELQLDDTLNETNKATIDTFNTRFPNILDGIILFTAIIAWLLAMVASFLIDSHPLFFAISIIIIVVLIFVGVNLTNAYEDISTDNEISSIVDDFPLSNYLLTHLHYYLIAIAISVGLTLYAKNQIG